MAGINTRTKDIAMAARLKSEGVVRKVARCPICNKVVNVKGFYSHIVTCSRH